MPLPTSRRILLGTAAATPLAAPALAQTAPVTIKLRLLETSDLHTFDEDYDYYRDQPDETVGLTKVATLVAQARAGAKNVMLFDDGDIIQGNPLSDYVATPGHFPKDGIHPTIRAMNGMGYDAATLGNHEFNYGLPFLDAAIAKANFPFVCANLQHLDGSPYLPPTLILTRSFIAEDGSQHRLKIGVIGFLPPQIMEWDEAHLAGKVQTIDIVEAAQKYVPALREKVDLLVALSHSGISTAPRRGGEENASFYLAAVPGIDVIFTGHSHRVFPGPSYAGLDGVDAQAGTLAGIPAVMPGFWGSELGQIDLTLTRRNGRWNVASFTTGTLPIAAREGKQVISLAANDPQVDAAVKPEHDATLAWIRQPIGHLSQPVNSYAALIGPDSSLALVNEAQLWYATPLLPDSLRHLPVLSAAAPFKEGYQSPDNYIDLAAGSIAIKDVADLYMYPNTVAAVRVNGAGLRAWLEHAAEIYNRIDPGNPAPQPLLNPHVPSYSFDVIAGITYEIDITQAPAYGHGASPGGRIKNLRYRGNAVADEDPFIVITNNYRADSGHIVDNPADIVLRAPDQVRDVLTRYIVTRKEISVAVPEIWSFARIGSPVLVTFESAPAAAAYLTRNKNVTRLGDGADGYTQFGLTLT